MPFKLNYKIIASRHYNPSFVNLVFQKVNLNLNSNKINAPDRYAPGDFNFDQGGWI